MARRPAQLGRSHPGLPHPTLRPVMARPSLPHVECPEHVRSHQAGLPECSDLCRLKHVGAGRSCWDGPRSSSRPRVPFVVADGRLSALRGTPTLHRRDAGCPLGRVCRDECVHQERAADACRGVTILPDASGKLQVVTWVGGFNDAVAICIVRGGEGIAGMQGAFDRFPGCDRLVEQQVARTCCRRRRDDAVRPKHVVGLTGHRTSHLTVPVTEMRGHGLGVDEQRHESPGFVEVTYERGIRARHCERGFTGSGRVGDGEGCGGNRRRRRGSRALAGDKRHACSQNRGNRHK
jgi:hypothetical protein